MHFSSKQIMKLLQKIGVENIDVVTLMDDCNNPGCNRGFAFLELDTSRDAQIAYKKLSRKDVFGKGINIRVAWAEPLDDLDEKQMQKVSLSHTLFDCPLPEDICTSAAQMRLEPASAYRIYYSDSMV